MAADHETRWSDSKLQEFYESFQRHQSFEDAQKTQQDQIFDALFHKEDPDSNIGPGVIQLLSQINARLTRLESTNQQQRTFVGGVLFACSCVAVFLTDSVSKLIQLVRGL